MSMGPLKATAQGITFDEFGRPFIILKEQEAERRLTGLEAHKVCPAVVKDRKRYYSV